MINGAAMASRAGYYVYDAWAVTRWPRFVVRRGQTVLADGQCTAQPGQGQWVHRDPAQGRTCGPDQRTRQDCKMARTAASEITPGQGPLTVIRPPL